MKTSIREFIRNKYNETKRAIGHIKNLTCDSSPKLLILEYHRILPEISYDFFCTAVTVKTFARQINELKDRYPIISLSEAVRQSESQQPKDRIQVVLTFDDGYEDFYEFAFPILNKKGLKGCLFLSTDYIGKNIPLWDRELIMLLANNKSVQEVEIQNRKMRIGFMQTRRSFILEVIKRMKSVSGPIRQKIIDRLHAITRKVREPYTFHDRCITWKEAKELANFGFEIGSHSLSHSSLATLPFTEAREEIRQSKKIIEQNTERPCSHFAFPFGSKNDYNQLLINCVKEEGFKTCLLNVHGYNHLKKGAFCFKRIIMEQTTSVTYLLG